MKVSPLDLRQLRFRTAFRGFDRAEVLALVAEVADDYEHALREVDRLRQQVSNMETLLEEHRSGKANHAKPLWAVIMLGYWLENWS